jgi:Subtilase family/Repeat of unknown function (DUF5648)
MATTSERTPRPPANATVKRSGYKGERELIVVSRAEASLRAAHGVVASAAGHNVDPLNQLLAAAGAEIVPVFGNEARVARAMATAAPDAAAAFPTDLTAFYRVKADDDQLEALAAKMLELDLVEGAYVKPEAQPPVFIEEAMAPRDVEEPPASTPDFSARQLYLDPSPGGIDARFAWTQPGGKGQGVRIIDIEGAWRFSHEDLTQNQGGVIGGTQSADLGWRNHGTAVIGEFGGDDNGFGVTGICPQANVRAISIFGSGQSAAKAVTDAANALSPGDIILIELHAPGPRHNFTDVGGQLGFIAMEFWPDMFAAIVYATSVRGVIAVEAGGNGAENFDDPLYDVRPAGFPPSWRNPFNPANPQSGAIVVGAGAPPPGTHGRNHGTDRSRLAFSNFGARVDVQGWGREVTTCGYGDLQGGSNEDLWYTDTFSGTSSASPIIVGTVGSMQGVLRAAGKTLLTPATARNLLRTTGSPQQSEVGRPASQRIGNRPNLRQMIGTISPINTVPLHRYWNSGIGDHFYTTNWAELGSGNHGWGYEGVQCHVLPQPRTGTVPLYRYWNAAAGDHFYTTNWSELGSGRSGWGYEGIQCHVYPTQVAGTVPLYRYWNGQIADHFYTTNWAELGSGRYGWGYEGVQCYVFPRPAQAPLADGPEAFTESPPDDSPPPSDSGEAAGDVPETFRTGRNAGQGSNDEAPSTPPSFRLSKTGVPDSFTVLSDGKAGGLEGDGGTGQVIVHIHVGTRGG